METYGTRSQVEKEAQGVTPELGLNCSMQGIPIILEEVVERLKTSAELSTDSQAGHKFWSREQLGGGSDGPWAWVTSKMLCPRR
jgi:hypothetical protein